MKKYSRLFPIAGLFAAVFPAFASEPDLPKVEILGKEYYYHEINKGESIYGIAKQYGWNLDELVRLNPNNASQMKKGTRLYYPTGKVTVVSEVTTEEEPVDSVYEPIRHVVKKGETVYGISRQYNIPLESIYAAYPETKYGLKTGQTLEFQQTPEIVSKKYLYYVIKPGDTLYSLAQRYHTSVEDLLKANPGVSENNFRIGDTVRISVNSGADRYHTELVEEERLASIDSYKVKKKDTWTSISKKTGVDVETLKDANEDVSEPKKDEVINIPKVETVQVEKEVAGDGNAEPTPEAIREMYDSIHKVDSSIEQLREVRVAMLLDEPSSKKDVDFTRGFLFAIDEMKDSPFKINFKVIDGRGSETTVTDALDDFEPNIVVATADRNFPAFLADYGDSNHLEVVNVFDVKNELYEENPSIVQILTPSALFNEQVADRIASDYSSSELLMVGVEDGSDAIAEIVAGKFPESKVRKLSVNSLADYNFSDSESYLIYAYPQKKNEVAEVLHTVSAIKENNPVARISIVGRPSWITLTDMFRDNYNDAEIVVPARCWMDPEDDKVKRFTEEFTEMYDQAPVKSFPNFAATGYDIARYFINATAKNGGDFNEIVNMSEPGLQTEFKFRRVSNWGGFLNPVSYLLKFRPSGYIDKETIE